MRLSKRNSIFITITLISVFIILTFIATKLAETKTSAEMLSLQNLAANLANVIVINDFKRSLTKDGKKVWEVTGDKAEYAPKENSIKITGCHLYVVKDVRGKVEVIGDTATIFLDGNKLSKAVLAGNVQIIAESKVKLLTNQLEYIGETGDVTTQDHVDIISEFAKIAGEGLNGNMNTQVFKILKKVTSEVMPKKKD